MEGYEPTLCPRFHHAVELVGRRWTGAVIRILLQSEDHRARYNTLRAAIPDISDRMLIERLRELEAEGVVRREVVPETPVRVDYALTEKGCALEPALTAIGEWAHTWLGDSSPTAAAGAAPTAQHIAREAAAR